MSNSEEVIKTAIRKIAKKQQQMIIFVGVAKNVKDDVCDIERDNLSTLEDVRLNAVVDNLNSYFTVVPKENSYCLVGMIEDSADAVMLSCSEVQKIICKTGNNTVQIDSNAIVFNGQKNGLVKIENLITRINMLEDAINNHTHPYVNVAAAATTSPATPGTGIIVKAKKSDMEDTKILHS